MGSEIDVHVQEKQHDLTTGEWYRNVVVTVAGRVWQMPIAVDPHLTEAETHEQALRGILGVLDDVAGSIRNQLD